MKTIRSRAIVNLKLRISNGITFNTKLTQAKKSNLLTKAKQLLYCTNNLKLTICIMKFRQTNSRDVNTESSKGYIEII